MSKGAKLFVVALCLSTSTLAQQEVKTDTLTTSDDFDYSPGVLKLAHNGRSNS